MTLAFNILLALIVFVGVVGLLAYNIVATRTPAQPRLHPQPGKRPAAARQRTYGWLDSARA
jgi:hypothetical protein